jgi:hypothetical protein
VTTSGSTDACHLCDAGFRRVEGIHIGSQRLGMIPDRPCTRVLAKVHDAPKVRRRWTAHVDGEPLRRKHDGAIRKFATATAAVNAARNAAPRSWHS